ncbi:MAG: hypothetical protein Q4E67_08525, partial [Planctomycetia bacterium]|nr:hypothetical protein [Planctomycetia bacterium]
KTRFFTSATCHSRHNSIPAYGWIRRGVERELKSNCSRQHMSVINIDTLSICVTFSKTINTQTTVELFKKRISHHDLKTLLHLFGAKTEF